MPEVSPTAGLIRFGVFELDRRSGELRKAGVRVALQEQAFQVLTLLLERPGDLVTRDELCQRLWPNGTFVDFEHGLNAVVNRLRDTLGDSADTPRFVETIPRRERMIHCACGRAGEGTGCFRLARRGVGPHAGGRGREWFGHRPAFQAAPRERDMAGHRGTHGWRGSLSVRVSGLAIPARPDAKLAPDQPSRSGTPSKFFA